MLSIKKYFCNIYCFAYHINSYLYPNKAYKHESSLQIIPWVEILDFVDFDWISFTPITQKMPISYFLNI